MLTDDPLQKRLSSFDPFSLDDIFNLDATSSGLQLPSLAGGSQSSSSPRSPFLSSALPPTPPFTFATSVPQLATTEDSFYNFFLNEEFKKTPPPLPLSSPYDYLANPSAATDSTGIGCVGSSEPSSSSTSPSPAPYLHSPQPNIGIDPQLVGTPATSKAVSVDFSEEEEEEEEEEELEREELSILAKSTARGKASRKGTVLSGGVKKAPAITIDKEMGRGIEKSKREPASLKILEPADWRPSPEEYKKMSSKEKRQLRNKISARNFRVRRKGQLFV